MSTFPLFSSQPKVPQSKHSFLCVTYMALLGSGGIALTSEIDIWTSHMYNYCTENFRLQCHFTHLQRECLSSEVDEQEYHPLKNENIVHTAAAQSIVKEVQKILVVFRVCIWESVQDQGARCCPLTGNVLEPAVVTSGVKCSLAAVHAL